MRGCHSNRSPPSPSSSFFPRSPPICRRPRHPSPLPPPDWTMSNNDVVAAVVNIVVLVVVVSLESSLLRPNGTGLDHGV